MAQHTSTSVMYSVTRIVNYTVMYVVALYNYMPVCVIEGREVKCSNSQTVNLSPSTRNYNLSFRTRGKFSKSSHCSH